MERPGDLPLPPPDVPPPPPDVPPPPPDVPPPPPDVPPPPPDVPLPDITPDKPQPDIELDVAPPPDQSPDGSGTTAPAVTWVKRVWSNGSDYPLAMAQDGQGNLYLVGYHTGSALKVDSSTLASTAPSTSSGFVVSLANDGNVRWVRGIGNSKMGIIHDVALDSKSDVYITGYFKGTIKPNVSTLSTQGSDDIFVAKLKGLTGGHLWSKTFGSSSSDQGLSIAVDSMDNVYAAGTFQSSFTLNGKKLSSNGLRDVLLVSYNSSGGFRWAESAGGGNDDQVNDLAVGGNGQLYFGGQFLKKMDIGTKTLVSNGLSDMYLASFSSAGKYRWAARYGGGNVDSITSLTVVGANSVYAVGTFFVTTTVGGKTYTGKGNTDLLLMSCDDSGNLVWASHYGSKGLETAGQLARDTAGNLLLAASHGNDIFLGGTTLTGTGADGALFASFTSGGAHRWSKNHRSQTTSGLVTGKAVLADSKGHTYFMGQYKAPVNFKVPGGNILLMSASTDIYVLGTKP